jgi:hypothetical protein
MTRMKNAPMRVSLCYLDDDRIEVNVAIDDDGEPTLEIGSDGYECINLICDRIDKLESFAQTILNLVREKRENL